MKDSNTQEGMRPYTWQQELWRAIKWRGSDIVNRYNKFSANADPGIQEFEAGTAAGVDNGIIDSALRDRPFPSGSWVAVGPGQSRVEATLFDKYGDRSAGLVLIDILKDITDSHVIELLHPTVITSPIDSLNQGSFSQFLPIGVVSVIQPVDYTVLSAALTHLVPALSEGGVVLIYSSHDKPGILKPFDNDIQSGKYPLTSQSNDNTSAFRLFTKKETQYQSFLNPLARKRR